MKGWGRGSWLWWRIAQIRPNSPTQGRLAKRCRARCINLPNCYQFPAKPVASAGIWTFHQIFSDLRAELESCVRAKWLALNFLACVFVAENVAQSREEEGMSWGTLGLIYYVFQAGRYNAVRCRYITCSLKLPLLQECSPTLVEGGGRGALLLFSKNSIHSCFGLNSILIQHCDESVRKKSRSLLLLLYFSNMVNWRYFWLLNFNISKNKTKTCIYLSLVHAIFVANVFHICLPYWSKCWEQFEAFWPFTATSRAQPVIMVRTSGHQIHHHHHHHHSHFYHHQDLISSS